MKKVKTNPEKRPFCVVPRQRKRINPLLGKCESLKKPTSEDLVRRYIVDCPFYIYKYEMDDLPLDPAKAFVLEKICKFFERFFFFIFFFFFFLNDYVIFQWLLDLFF